MPLLSPTQNTLVDDKLIVGEGLLATVLPDMAVQPKASVTVTVYPPAHTLLNEAVVAPLLQI